MSAARLLGLTMVSAWLLTGCSSPKKIEVGGTCILNSACNSPLLCTDGKCHDACHASIDCPTGQNCVKTNDSTFCQLPAEADCSRTTCSSAYVCASDLRCRTPCQSVADCANEQVCVTNVCADPIELVPSTGQLPQKGPSLAADGGTDAQATATGGAGGRARRRSRLRWRRRFRASGCTLADRARRRRRPSICGRAAPRHGRRPAPGSSACNRRSVVRRNR